MKLCLYANFNNYYNRKVIKYDTLAEYQDKLLFVINNVNFRPNDGINTEAIIKTSQIISNEPFFIETIPDYLMAVEDDGTIVSRWFIMEYTSIIVGVQYKAVLRRDVIADNFEDIIEAPMFIEKATITKKDDIAIFNNENMSFNQIKESETPLIDSSECAWIVGFLPGNAEIGSGEDGIQLNISGSIYDVPHVSNTEMGYIPSFLFKMFAIPYIDGICYKNNYENPMYPTIVTSTTEIYMSKQRSVAIATRLAAAVGSGNVFDVQLLPYCPLRFSDGINKFVKDKTGQRVGQYNITDIDNTIITALGTPSTPECVLLWCSNNKFSFDINYSLPLPDTALEMKVNNECDMYRLCSPNFNGQFEFNPMKNNGVTKFNVDITYQPYNSYIHINPDFGGLYGQDFNDARGLICGGDFSLPQESSQWANYVQNNKNYQQIFDRQIENMEFNNGIARVQAGTSAFTGSLQGASTGAFIGAGIGGPVGAVAGAAIGGAASAVGGVMDYSLLVKQQKEAIDYTRDLFGYNMSNIKAMPNSITKSNPFTNNNKIFPVIEKYSCTDIEKTALENKLKYNGMTIGRIGKIKDWLLDDYSYIKGQLIMIDTLEEEYHTVVEIAQELNNGIRAKKEEA